ncbi:flagellar basal body rod protein FlgC [Actinomarinicola tropica]|uniref:Flagellar basal-body rod protein FlgC n=1 Tax=Actinomarinicola tropica TaxID=2789776 RepID=A0A5Q2RJ99_9ACTN|nr:flagellar basal body rod protein FlgC [Actinomarinicola tropica]QGG94641.1 flagellar basal body rod protein FlgC [Actinomarinicola tropica]
MSALFGSIAIAGSGMGVYKTWIDATADNVANVNTVRSTDEAAFQQRFVVSAAAENGAGQIGNGARVAGVLFGDAEGRLVYDPAHPLADEQGMVRHPDMNLSDQMTNLIIAQRAYQANVTVFERARDAYLRGLEIGR